MTDALFISLLAGMLIICLQNQFASAVQIHTCGLLLELHCNTEHPVLSYQSPSLSSGQLQTMLLPSCLLQPICLQRLRRPGVCSWLCPRHVKWDFQQAVHLLLSPFSICILIQRDGNCLLLCKMYDILLVQTALPLQTMLQFRKPVKQFCMKACVWWLLAQKSKVLFVLL